MAIESLVKEILDNGISIKVKDSCLEYKIPEYAEHAGALHEARNREDEIAAFIGEGREWTIASFNQENWLNLSQSAIGKPESAPMAVMVYGKGTVDIDLVRAGVDKLIARHEAIRTTFTFVEKRLAQVVHDDLSVSVEQLTWHYPYDVFVGKLNEITSEKVKVNFDPIAGPSFKISVVNNDGYWGIILCIDHLVFDGVSALIFLFELSEFYNAYANRREPQLSAVVSRYADYNTGYRRQVSSHMLANNKAYWQNMLQNAPLSSPKPDSIQDQRPLLFGETIRQVVGQKLVDAIKMASQRDSLSLSTIFLTAYAILLKTYFGDKAHSVGIQSNNRKANDNHNTIGFFTEVIPVKLARPGHKNFIDLAHEQKANLSEAQEYLPFPVGNQLGVPTKFFYNYFQVPVDITMFNGCSVLSEEMWVPIFDFFQLWVRVNDVFIEFAVQYDPTYLSRETVDEMMVDYQRILEDCVRDTQTLVSLTGKKVTYTVSQGCGTLEGSEAS